MFLLILIVICEFSILSRFHTQIGNIILEIFIYFDIFIIIFKLLKISKIKINLTL